GLFKRCHLSVNLLLIGTFIFSHSTRRFERILQGLIAFCRISVPTDRLCLFYLREKRCLIDRACLRCKRQTVLCRCGLAPVSPRQSKNSLRIFKELSRDLHAGRKVFPSP